MKRQREFEIRRGRPRRTSGSCIDRVDLDIPTDVYFVLEIDERPVLAFSATNLKSAQERATEPWLIDELAQSNSGGKPILGPGGQCTVRLARPFEATEVEVNRFLDRARGEDSKYGFAFLVPVDVLAN